MEPTEKRQPVALYEVPLLPELEVKSLIIKELPQAQLALDNIILRRKQGKYQAFLMVPPNKVEEICILKTLTINKESVTIKKPFTEAQVFIGRIPDTLSIDDIRTSVESQFGKIVKIHEGQPHEETKSKLKHCYIQFTNPEDAEKCLFTPKKLIIKGNQLRPSRAYAMNQSDETDKKLFLKINSQIEDHDDLEWTINEQFRKEGKLRQKIRVENNKATIIYTSANVADKVLNNFKGNKIGKYDVVLRPYANKDNHTAFLGGLKPSVTQADLQIAFKRYEPLVACSVQKTNMNIYNGTVTFGSKQFSDYLREAYSQCMVDYKDDQAIKQLFVNQAYVTQHMSAKDRNQYHQFKKGKVEKKQGQNAPLIPPPAMNYPMMGPAPMQNPFMMPMNRPNPNYITPPPNQNQYYQPM